MKTILAIVATFLATPVLAQAAKGPPIGYTTEGLQDSREPWSFNWSDPDSEWLRLGQDADRADWFIQLSSDMKVTSQPKTFKKAWIKLDFSRDAKIHAREAKALYIINCENETYSVPSMIYYDASNSPSGPPESYSSETIVPETTAHLIEKRVCRE